MKNKKITQKSTLKEILEIPGTKEILEKYGVPCLFCPMAGAEMEKLKIENICQAYGINLKELLFEINNYLKKNGKEK